MVYRLDLIKPQKFYRNFDDFLRKQQRGDILYPCLRCSGKGSIIRPDEKPCIMEGHKFSDRITCPLCLGSREGGRKEYIKLYKKYNRDQKEQVKQWKERTDLIKSGLSKLNEQEKKVFGIEWITEKELRHLSS